MKQLIFVTGLFRSGTTWLARALNAHPQIAFESDPIAPIFNSFRHDIAKKEYKTKNLRFSPLEDYFDKNTDLLNLILHSNLKTILKKNIANKILRLIKEKNLPFENGNWTSTFTGFKNCKNYSDAINQAIKHIDSISKKKSKVVGFKEVWTNEMAAPLLRSFNNSKSIIITRDPRSILASRNAMMQKYPPIFIARQWRKSIFIENFLKKNFKDRVLSVRYEDLITKKEKYFKKICKFLDVKFSKNLLDEDKYLDGQGNPWKKNSSFSYEGKRYIVSSNENFKKKIRLKDKFLKKNNIKSKEKWKSTLSKNDINTIEFICYDEMKYMNYKLVNNLSKVSNMSASKLKTYPKSKLANWIKPYAIDQKKIDLKKIINDEKQRLKLIKNKKYIDSFAKLRFQII